MAEHKVSASKLSREQRTFVWEEIRSLYEDSDCTLAEISEWSGSERGWSPSASAITNRASRYGWRPRQQRCLLFPDGMLSTHIRDHYANAVRAEGKVRRGLKLGPMEAEKLRQASSMIGEGLALAYTPDRGFYCVTRPDDLPNGEWLTWWQDFEGCADTDPVTASDRLMATLLTHYSRG